MEKGQKAGKEEKSNQRGKGCMHEVFLVDRQSRHSGKNDYEENYGQNDQ